MALLLHITPITEEQATQFVRWKNPPPYELNDMVDDPADKEAVAESVAYFLKPEIGCHALTFPNNELIGFATFGLDAQVPGGNYTALGLDIGLGIRPDLTDQGKGIHVITQLLQFARHNFPHPFCRVTIEENNIRAQKVWRRAGFTQKQRFSNQKLNRCFLIFTDEQSLKIT